LTEPRARIIIHAAMMRAENRVGRLCEATFLPPFSMAETEAFAAETRRLVAAGARPVVFVCEMRRVQIFPPGISDVLTALMQSDNPRVARNALLIGESSTFGLQIERMLRDAGSPSRRTFRAPAALLKWLGEVLTPSEVERAATFVAGGG
jgi:hypothetical protein